MEHDLSKAELRAEISARIAELPEEYIRISDIELAKAVEALPEFASARNIMIYYSVGREAGTHGIAAAALSAGKTVAFPHCERGGLMRARVVAGLDELRPAMLGIPAPSGDAPVIPAESLDLIVVPALAYDMGGYRLGYGGGYYDRYLSATPAFTVGMVRERLLAEELPREAHDVAVKCLVTECRVYRSELIAVRTR